jgi:hypothetical protein
MDRCKSADGAVVDIHFSEKTKITDVKRKMAQVKNIPAKELENYGIFITKKDDVPLLTSAETTNEDLWYPRHVLTIISLTACRLEEGVNELGDFMPFITDAQSGLAFRKMKKQVTKLLKVTTSGKYRCT